jgi:ATP-binding cassette subfamily F protein uup
MDTLDLLEDVLADYEGTLILVSHDRDFVDRLATSTIALNGRGDVVETPGGWQDFLRQNPGFFRAAPVTPPAPKAAAARQEPAKSAKLSYKDQRRLEELEGLLAKIPAEIARLESEIADPGLYSRDFPKFDRLMKATEKLRADLSAAENEWLGLEERREALQAGR